MVHLIPANMHKSFLTFNRNILDIPLIDIEP